MFKLYIITTKEEQIMLTEIQVLQIAKELMQTKTSQTLIAKKFKTTVQIVNTINMGTCNQAYQKILDDVIDFYPIRCPNKVSEEEQRAMRRDLILLKDAWAKAEREKLSIVPDND